MSYNWKPALSTNAKEINEDLFRAYAESGLEAMEVSAHKKPLAEIPFAKIKEWADQYQIMLWSYHLPYSPFDQIDISKPELAAQTIALWKQYIQKAVDIGIKIFVVHPGGEPIPDAEREMRIACSKQSLKELAEFADSLGAKIAVEDLPRTCIGNCSKEILDLISADPRLGVCFDTNHLLGEDTIQFIRNVGNRLITVHISDYDYVNERHWLPGEGQIDWQAVIAAMQEVGYQGAWLYEIHFTTPWHIARDRDLNCTDFYRNYTELMNGKPLTVPGKPKDSLGMWDFTYNENL